MIQFAEGVDAIDVTATTVEEGAEPISVRISGKEFREFLAEYFKEMYLRQKALKTLEELAGESGAGGLPSVRLQAAQTLLGISLSDVTPAQLTARSNRK